MLFNRIYTANCFKFSIITFVLLFFGSWHSVFSQSCDPNTPFFNVNLSSNADSVWTSPVTVRDEHCCAASGPENCIEFLVALSPYTVALNFSVAAGANPPGWYYQINCGAQVALGSPICLNGPGPIKLTICKPGNNPMQFKITSIAGPIGSPDKTIGNGCNTTMSISGVTNSTITWNSIFPGASGAYNSYLSCSSACASTTVTAQTGHPAYVDYRVCGTPTAGICAFPGQFCDTVRVYMATPLLNSINPSPASFCANNPSVVLTGTVNGGVPPYTYAWTNASNGGGTVVGTGLTYTATAVGNYSFLVYDQNYPACPAPVTNVTVTSSPVPVVNAGSDQTTCGTSVTLNGTVTGATGGIWSGGNGTFSPDNTSLTATYTPSVAELASGTVILTLSSTGNGSCSAVSDQVILHVSTPISVSISPPTLICFGQMATLTANVSGGIAPFTYLWNSGETTQTISNVSSGAHTVTVTGAAPGLCTATATATLTNNPQITVTTSSNTIFSCSASATISAAASGGTGTLSYLWSNGVAAASTSVNTGNYIITVTDANGCTATNSVNVTAGSDLLVSVNQPAALCNGATVSLTATVTGGVGGNSFLWNTGETVAVINHGVGNYCVTVTDAGGCISQNCALVTEHPALTASIPTPSIICNGASVTVNASASGGVAPYTYLWNTGQTTQSKVSTTGTYTVTVTDFAGCSTTASVTVSQEPLLALTMSAIGVGCFGGNDGSANAAVSGGVTPYYYSWAPVGGSSATASGLIAGTYSVTVTDTIGCTANATIVVTQPLVLSASIAIQNQVSCNGGNNGAAIVNPVGGTAPFTYAWSPGGGAIQNVTNLSAGTYTVTITDSEGCQTTAQTIITEPSQLTSSVVSTTHVSCNGSTNGAAAILAAGGSPGYTYSWAPSGGTNAASGSLTAGSYTVTVTDTKLCVKSLTIVINQPPPLTVVTSHTNVSCNGGSDGTATVVPSGGASPYTYSWNTSPIQTSPTASNLNAGTYSVTVTDSQNCNVISSGVTVTEPQVLVVAVAPSSASILCNSNIALSAIVNGGTPVYTYLWSTGAASSGVTVNTGSYNVTVTDALGCVAHDSSIIQASNSALASSVNQPPNLCYGDSAALIVTTTGGIGTNTYLWNTGETTATITVGAGNHCVTVTDGGGCITSSCVTVTENTQIGVIITPPPPDICPGDSTTIIASGFGGQPAYVYSWNTGETTATIIKPAGTYTVTISDVTGNTCSSSVSVTVSEVPPIVIVMNTTHVNCLGAANGYISAIVSGGAPAYTYLWAPSGGTNALATHLSPQTYTLTVTDASGCVKTNSATITQPTSSVVISLTNTNNLCFGDSIGTATVTPSGGTAPYSYYWTVVGDTLATITGLKANTYEANVSDSKGCLISGPVVITQPTELMLTASVTPIVCSAGTGSVTLTSSGGTGTRTITGDATTNLVAGTYNYTVTDANGCSKTIQAVVNPAPPAVVITATASQILCFGGTGSVALVPSGGTGALTITASATTGLVAGTYNYTVTDSNGCTATASAVINAAPPVVSLVATANQISCSSGTGSVTLVASGGTGALTITGSATTGLVAGTYNYTVTDANGCTATASATINAAPPVVSLTATATQILCFGGTGSVALVPSGGTGALTISGSATTGLVAGTYNYNVTDANGCTATASATINAAPPAVALTATATQILCFGGTGSVALVPSGGTGALTITGSATTGLVAGTYNYTVTDANGCTATASAVINAAPPAVSLVATANQISCSGGTGSVTLVASGGTGALTITGSATTGLVAGTYNYTVTDANGCTATASATINAAPPVVSLTATATQILCFGGTGSVALVPSGGTGALTISGSATTGLVAGTYNYNVTDANGCTATASATINAAPPAVALTATATQILCFGGTGSVALVPSGGTGALTITGSATTGLVAGTYNYTVTDANGCTATASATINAAPPAVALTATPTQILCFGGTGSVTLVPSGGTGTLTITGSATTGLVAGTYNYTVTDASGCTATASATINAAPPAVALTASATQITCTAGGSVSLVSSGGTGTLTITGDATTNLSAGTYNYIVTDANGCVATAQAVINPQLLFPALTATPSQINCFGGTGSVVLVSSGGLGPLVITGDATTSLLAGTYNYLVTDSVGCTATAQAIINTQPAVIGLSATAAQISCFGGTGSVTLVTSGGTGTLTISGDPTTSLAAGTYNYMVTDANGCNTTASATINTAPPVLALSATAAQITCFGGTGSVVLTPSGGTGTLTITGDPVTNLLAGTYNYSVTDANGCIATASAIINAAPSAVVLTATTTQISCFGGTGSVILAPSGGTGTLTITGDATTGLLAGTYNYTVTDANGCTANASATINAAPAAVALTATVTQISCFGGTGSVILAASGGTGALTISGDATTNLLAGAYNYTVTDANGCTANASATINAAPPVVTLSVTPAQISCFGGTGSVVLTPSGGTGTLTITGDPTTNLLAGTYNYTVTDANGCIAIASATINAAPSAVVLTATATQISCFGGTGTVLLTASGGTGTLIISGDAITSLLAGTYNYLVTDSMGCTAIAQATINPEPSVVALTATTIQISCFGGTGSVVLTPSGGMGTLTITGDPFTNLLAGTYNYTVTDANGCTATASATINTAPPILALSATAAQISCFGGTGSVLLTPTGGTGTLAITGDPTTNLLAGTYNYTVIDANGCIATASATINAAPSAVVLAATATQINCFGGTGSVSLVLGGGTGTLVLTGDDTLNLLSGTYNYTLMDSLGCSTTSQAVINTEPAVLSALVSAVQITCFGLTNGTATVVVTGGTAPFNYTWQNGETTSTITGLAAGTYSIAIADDRGCTASASTAISEPAAIVLTESTVPSSCGNSNGAATVTATGGTGAYSYAWQPAVGTTATISTLFSGDYTVIVTDSNSCEQQIMLTVESISFLLANFGATSACINSPIVFTDSSLTSPGSITTWEWDFGNSSAVNSNQNPVFEYTSSGVYNVSLIVTSSNGCIDTIIKPVTVYVSPSAGFVSSKACFGFSTAFTDQSVAPPGGNITSWEWDFGDSSPLVTVQNPNHTYSLSGTYISFLTVSSDNGCMDTATFSTIVYSPPIALFTVDDSSGCLVHCAQFTNISTSLSGTIAFQQWDFGDGTNIGTSPGEEHCYMNSGTYSVSLTVTSSFGCVSTITQSNLITVYEVPKAEFAYAPKPPTSIASEIYFDNLSVGASEWLWDFGDPVDTTSSILEYPTHNYANVGNYCITLYVENSNQCRDSIVHCLEVEPEFTFFIPNAFTPYNSSGVNDGFSGYGTNISKYDMWIYDRWGNTIFHTNDLNIKWDGKAKKGKDIAQRDVYVYLVELLDFRGAPHQYRGTVTLVR